MNGSDTPLELLLVEDSEEDVFFFQRALKKCGVPGTHLQVATDGQSAVELLGSQTDAGRPDLVFLDLKLPRLSGFEVLRWVRQQSLYLPPQIVVLSGSPHEKDRKLAAELGAVDYLVKPISSQALACRLINAAQLRILPRS